MNSKKFYEDKLEKLKIVIDDVQQRRDEVYEFQLFYTDIYKEYQKIQRTHDDTLQFLNRDRESLETTIRSIHPPAGDGQENGGG